MHRKVNTKSAKKINPGLALIGHSGTGPWPIRSGSYVHDVHRSSCKILMNGQKTFNSGSMSKSTAEEAQPKPYDDFFAEKRDVEPF